MTITKTQGPASEKQIAFMLRLLAERPNWSDVLNGNEYERAFDALGNVGNADPKFIGSREASSVIDALLAIRPTVSTTSTPDQAEVTRSAEYHVG